MLEELRKAAKCEFLSDLHDPSYWPQLAQAVEALPAVQYDAIEWQNALQYIIGKEVALDTAEALRTRLLEKIRT